MRLIALLILIFLLSCNGTSSAGAQNKDSPAQPDSPAVEPQAGEESQSETLLTSYFNEASAWMYMEKQVGFGFRVPGTQAHKSCKNWLVAELGRYCDTVEVQTFEERLGGAEVELYNIIGRFKPDAERRILLLAHWDTRPTAEYNPFGQRDKPIEGANDGASGVAVLLELARVFSAHEPPVGIDILLTDGEDYGPTIEHMFLGAKHFASELSNAEVAAYNYGVLLDMIGDADLAIHPESNSEGPAKLVYLAAYEISRSLGFINFKKSGTVTVLDDHLALNDRGMHVYDFIDFDYPYWHTTEDTLDKCSALSLEVVGVTVENLIYRFPNLYAPE